MNYIQCTEAFIIISGLFAIHRMSFGKKTTKKTMFIDFMVVLFNIIYFGFKYGYAL